MIPPPAMTTSALSMPEQSPVLEDHLQSREGRDVAVVERRRHLHDVQPNQLRAGGGYAQEVERLAGGEPARRGDLSPRRESGVEDVDVEGNMETLAIEGAGDHARGSPSAGHLDGGHHPHAPSPPGL